MRMIIMMLLMMMMMVITPMSVASIKSQCYKQYTYLFFIIIKNNLCLEYSNNNIDDDDGVDEDVDVASIVIILCHFLHIIFIIYK